MLTLKTLDDATTTIDRDTMDVFRSDFRGQLIEEGDANYDEARQIWNRLIDKRPKLIARCTGQADVIAAVKFAKDHDLLFSVRGGGHNVSGSALCDGGLTIDLSDMRAVRVDCRSNTVHVQGGATLADVDRETQVFGLATTTGNVSDTGIAGLTLGGGFGNLRRKHGLSVDNLVSVDIVTAEGEIVHSAEDENAELYWAIRGGGGNFGVVTSFEFRLFPLGPEVYFAAQFFDLKDAPTVFRRWRDLVERGPDELSSIAFLWTVPSVDGFPPELQGRRVFLYGALYAGSADEGEAATAALRNIGTPVLDLSGAGPYCVWQSSFDPFFSNGAVYDSIYAYWKSLYLRAMSDDQIEELVEAAKSMPSDQCLIALWHLGGAMSRVGETDTAFGKRNAPYLLSFDSCWTDSVQSDTVIAWTRAQIAAAERHGAGGLYLNFPGVGDDSEDLVRAAYGKNYDRLAAIKAQYDPTNRFRINQNIRPRA